MGNFVKYFYEKFLENIKTTKKFLGVWQTKKKFSMFAKKKCAAR